MSKFDNAVIELSEMRKIPGEDLKCLMHKNSEPNRFVFPLQFNDDMCSGFVVYADREYSKEGDITWFGGKTADFAKAKFAIVTEGIFDVAQLMRPFGDKQFKCVAGMCTAKPSAILHRLLSLMDFVVVINDNDNAGTIGFKDFEKYRCLRILVTSKVEGHDGAVKDIDELIKLIDENQRIKVMNQIYKYIDDFKKKPKFVKSEVQRILPV